MLLPPDEKCKEEMGEWQDCIIEHKWHFHILWWVEQHSIINNIIIIIIIIIRRCIKNEHWQKMDDMNTEDHCIIDISW